MIAASGGYRATIRLSWLALALALYWLAPDGPWHDFFVAWSGVAVAWAFDARRLP